MTPLLEAQALTKHFGSLAAVRDISFTLRRGEVLGFLGPNGAGKSTTMKMLTGFLRPTSGEARIAGFSLDRQPIAAKRRLGYLPEGAPAYGDMAVRDFLHFVGAARGMGDGDRAPAVDRAVQAAHLHAVLHQPIETLSKGFRRRVGLAQALLHDPEVLILDEPTDGLDPNQKHEMRKLIQAMAADKAIIISTHILEEVEAVCSRAMVIDRGRVVADGTPAELRARSRYHNAVTLILAERDENRVRNALGALPVVADVELAHLDDGKIAATALPRHGSPILEAVTETARAADLVILEIAVDPGRLDDVFRKLTTEEVGLSADRNLGMKEGVR